MKFLEFVNIFYKFFNIFQTREHFIQICELWALLKLVNIHFSKLWTFTDFFISLWLFKIWWEFVKLLDMFRISGHFLIIINMYLKFMHILRIPEKKWVNIFWVNERFFVIPGRLFDFVNIVSKFMNIFLMCEHFFDFPKVFSKIMNISSEYANNFLKSRTFFNQPSILWFLNKFSKFTDIFGFFNLDFFYNYLLLYSFIRIVTSLKIEE